jgi:pimeloyl-ACP methyl ester carboxylesterase
VAYQLARDTELSARCGAANGGLLDHVSTTEVARDLDVLRAAVGDEKMTFVGYSYGTYLGSVYANLFPQRVRAQVLDAVLDPVDFTNGPRSSISSARIESDEGAYATLLQFFRTCADAGERCAFSAGDPQAKYEELAARLRETPVTLETPEGPVTVTYALLVNATLGTLYSPVAWPDFAAALQELYDALPAGAGTGTAYARMQARLEDARTRFAADDDYVNGAEGFLAVACGDTDNPRNPLRWPTTARARDQVAPYFGSPWTWVTSPCATWPGRAEDRYTGPWTARTANPVLIVGERFDPATNYEAAQKLNNLLPNSTLLTLDGYGHTAQLSTCADTAVTTYLVSGATPPAGTVCRQDVGPFDPLPATLAVEEVEAEAARALAAVPDPLVQAGQP